MSFFGHESEPSDDPRQETPAEPGELSGEALSALLAKYGGGVPAMFDEARAAGFSYRQWRRYLRPSQVDDKNAWTRDPAFARDPGV